MSVIINNIRSGKDTNVGILLYIRNNVSVDMEIGKIVSGQCTDVVIREFFQTSADHKKLQEHIIQQHTKVQQLPSCERDDAAYGLEKRKLQELEKAEVSFRTNALRLAECFLKIKSDTERLQRARMLFEEGNIIEADRILVEWEIMDDQDMLITQMQYLQQRQKDMMCHFTMIQDR